MELTKKLVKGAMVAALAIGAAGCSDKTMTDDECDDLEWDKKTKSYVCDDEDSPRYRSYFYNGTYYSSKSALKSGKASAVKSSTVKSSSKSGIGSGKSGGSVGG